MQNSPEVAMRWLEEAVIQAASDGNRTIKESQVHQVMKQVRKQAWQVQNKEISNLDSWPKVDWERIDTFKNWHCHVEKKTTPIYIDT
jgi:hypothetical protein